MLVSRVVQRSAARSALTQRARRPLRSQTLVSFLFSERGVCVCETFTCTCTCTCRHSHARAQAIEQCPSCPSASSRLRLICARIVCRAPAVATRDCSIIRPSACPPLLSRAIAAAAAAAGAAALSYRIGSDRILHCLVSCSASESASASASASVSRTPSSHWPLA